MIQINDKVRINKIDELNLQVEEYRKCINPKTKQESFKWKWVGYYGDLKMRMTDVGYYDSKNQELKKIPLLLIDDFLWTNRANPSEEDFKLAKEIIDERQANDRKTIVTSNWTIKQMNGMSEVIGGRIYQACGSQTNFAFTYGIEAKNYRARNLPTLTDITNVQSPFEAIQTERRENAEWFDKCLAN